MDVISNHWKSTTEAISGKLQNIDDFLNWTEIKETMIFTDEIIHQQEKSFIQAHNHQYQNIANKQEATINSYHQLFHLTTFESMKKCSIRDYETVIEFGGGYGEQCRLIKSLIKSIKPEMNYYIIDLPEMIVIQKHYLTKHNIQNVHQISIEELPKIHNKTVFFGYWSISETPKDVRDIIFRHITDNRLDFFIAYQTSYGEYNNDMYFSQLSYPGYKITRKRMDGGMCDNFYMVGEIL